MATISVDVNIGEFDTDDIISELESRLSRLNKTDEKALVELIKKYQKEVIFEAKSKVDEWKMEVITANLERYSLEQIEAFFAK